MSKIMKISKTPDMKTLSPEQLLLCRICGGTNVRKNVERELDRRSVVANLEDYIKPTGKTSKRRRVA
ncbi:MAG: hypothetical protein ACK54H_10345 [Phycisphaerales bacterium]|jgi:hypothetical protein